MYICFFAYICLYIRPFSTYLPFFSYICSVKRGKEFIERLNEREAEAFHELYQKYFRLLVLFAMRFMDDVMVAEDVVEDVIVTVYENNVPFESLATFKAYLYNAVRNKALNHLKHTNVHQRWTENAAMDAEGTAYSLSESADESIEEMYVSMFEALDALPARCREVILLCAEGKSNAEIAELLDLSIETVKTHRKRALKMLREKLNSLAFAIFFLDFIHFS